MPMMTVGSTEEDDFDFGSDDSYTQPYPEDGIERPFKRPKLEVDALGIYIPQATQVPQQRAQVSLSSQTDRALNMPKDREETPISPSSSESDSSSDEEDFDTDDNSLKHYDLDPFKGSFSTNNPLTDEHGQPTEKALHIIYGEFEALGFPRPVHQEFQSGRRYTVNRQPWQSGVTLKRKRQDIAHEMQRREKVAHMREQQKLAPAPKASAASTSATSSTSVPRPICKPRSSTGGRVPMPSPTIHLPFQITNEDERIAIEKAQEEMENMWQRTGKRRYSVSQRSTIAHDQGSLLHSIPLKAEDAVWLRGQHKLSLWNKQRYHFDSNGRQVVQRMRKDIQATERHRNARLRRGYERWQVSAFDASGLKCVVDSEDVKMDAVVWDGVVGDWDALMDGVYSGDCDKSSALALDFEKNKQVLYGIREGEIEKEPSKDDNEQEWEDIYREEGATTKAGSKEGAPTLMPSPFEWRLALVVVGE